MTLTKENQTELAECLLDLLPGLIAALGVK